VSRTANNIILYVGLAASVALFVCLVVALSLEPIRHHLREQYGFQLPEWYDQHPADTERERAIVKDLFAYNDSMKALFEETLKQKHEPELNHGRRDTSTVIFPFFGRPKFQPARLSGRYERDRSLCHSDYGWLDRNLSLCKYVDKSADAAVRYADDVESYWTERLRPTPLPFMPLESPATWWTRSASLEAEPLKKQESETPKPSGERLAVVAPPKPTASEDGCDGVLISVAQSGERPCIKPGSAESFKDCLDCPEMVIVPAGTFIMGSPEPEQSPEHRVTIPKPFAVGKYAVTFAEWDACVRAEACAYNELMGAVWERSDKPVTNMTWGDAKAYTVWLSRKTLANYRLLSEAEREYAARAGTTTTFWWGSSATPELMNFNYDAVPYQGNGSSSNYFKPNIWGLHQVHSVTWEWVEDCHHANYVGAPLDGSAWTTGECKYHVIRGRASSRRDAGVFDGGRTPDVGFRVAREATWSTCQRSTNPLSCR